MPRGTAITQKKTWHSCTSVIYSCMAKTGQGNHAEWQKPKKEITLIGRTRKRKSCWMAITGKGMSAGRAPSAGRALSAATTLSAGRALSGDLSPTSRLCSAALFGTLFKSARGRLLTATLIIELSALRTLIVFFLR